MRVVVTRGSGFIGSAVCRYLIDRTEATVLDLDKLTYAAVPGSLDAVEANGRYTFRQVAICGAKCVRSLLAESAPDAIIHLAAESHVDRSIDTSTIREELGWKPSETIETGLVRTVDWCLRNQDWLENVAKNRYTGERLVLRQKNTQRS